MNARPLFALAAAALTTGLLVTSTVSAAPFGPRSVEVSYADLNLASSAGRAALDRRIEAAADRVCGQRGAVGLKNMRAADQCRLAAIADAAPKVAFAAAQSSQQLAAVATSAGGR